MVNAGFRSTWNRRLILGGLVIALKLTGVSLSFTRGWLMKFMPRLGVSLVSEAGMFWWTPSVQITGAPPRSLRCLALVRIRILLLLLGGVWGDGLVWESVWKAETLSAHFDGKQSRGPVDLPSVSQSPYLSLQVTGDEAAPVGSGFTWWHWPIGYVSSFFEEDSWCPGPSSRCGTSTAPSFG